METSEAARKPEHEIWTEQKLEVQGRRAQFAREYFLHEKKDVDRILALAIEFKDYGDHASNSTLTPDVLKKIEKMEDLVYDLRKLMYAEKVRRIKKSGTDLFMRGENADSGGSNGPDKRLQQASALSFELATRLTDTTYHYLDQANQNTFSMASLATAKDVVKIAAKLEGLAHEIREAYRPVQGVRRQAKYRHAAGDARKSPQDRGLIARPAQRAV
jgi:hypothetical protein